VGHVDDANAGQRLAHDGAPFDAVVTLPPEGQPVDVEPGNCAPQAHLQDAPRRARWMHDNRRLTTQNLGRPIRVIA